MLQKEQEIIKATIACIEKYGIQNTTIRRIGMTAGVNSAAVNYYFRSKDVLIQHAFDIALDNAFDFENFSDSKTFPIKERLTHIMEGMIVGALRYPNLTKAFFSELLLENNYASPMVRKCNTFLSKIEHELAKEYPDRVQIDVRMALVQISTSTFLFMGLFPRFFTSYPEIDLSDEKTRRTYVESLVEKLF